MSRGSLARRLVVGSSLWLLVALGIGGAALASAFRQSARAGFDARLEAILLACTAALDVAPDGDVTLARELGDPRFDRVFSGWYWQVSDATGVLAASRSLWDASLEALPGIDGAESVAAPLRGPRDERLRALARRVELPGRTAPLLVLVAGEESVLRLETQRFEIWLLASLALLAAVLVASVLLQVRYGLEPLRQLSSDLERIRKGDLERLPDDHPSELVPLVRSLDALLQHEAEVVRRARSQVGNLAHALKTPLSLIMAEASELAGGQAEAVARHAASMQRLIEHRLARAATAGASGALSARVAVKSVVEAIAASLGRLHPSLRIEVDAPVDLAFRGEKEDFEEIVGNLLENACKWATRRVRFTAKMPGRELELEVEDDGPGRHPDELARALERGVRLDERAPGFGLGLSIVQEVVELYGGALRLGSSELGGVRASVHLPLPAAGDESSFA